MESTPTERADDLPSVLGVVKNDTRARSLNNSLQRPDFDPNSIKDFCLPAEAPPS